MSHKILLASLMVTSIAMVAALPCRASSVQVSTELAFILSCNPLQNARDEDRTHARPDLSHIPGIKSLFVGAIGFYRRFISPQDLPACNFVPTCSQFSAKAIGQLGALRGILLTADRLQRCNGMSTSCYEVDYKSGMLADPVQTYSEYLH